MTSAWAPRNDSSELKTSTKKAGSRSAAVRRSRTANSRRVVLRRADRRSGNGCASGAIHNASGDGDATGATSVLMGVPALRPAPIPADGLVIVPARRWSPDSVGSDWRQLVAQVAAAAQGPLRLARRRL